MPGLTAKVFRTYNASYTLDQVSMNVCPLSWHSQGVDVHSNECVSEH